MRDPKLIRKGENMRDVFVLYVTLQVVVQLCIHFALLIVWGINSIVMH